MLAAITVVLCIVLVGLLAIWMMRDRDPRPARFPLCDPEKNRHAARMR